jgi:hypothetical protein
MKCREILPRRSNCQAQNIFIDFACPLRNLDAALFGVKAPEIPIV